MGHGPAEQALLNAAQGRRPPHAWLFTGPRGIGKATLAYRFARYLLRTGGAKSEGAAAPSAHSAAGLAVSPDHPVARQVAAASHPDLFVLERGIREDGRPRRDIDVDSVRQLSSFLHMTAADGGWRVAIVDAADELNRNAANALLKLLEEPPAQTVLLLISHAPGRLLPTITSRCRRLRLMPLREEVVADLLQQHLKDAETDQIDILVQLSEGSFGRALSFAEEGGVELYRKLLELFSELPEVGTARLHAFADSVAQDGSGGRLRATAEVMLWWLARMLRAGAQRRPPVDVIEGEGAVMQRLLDGHPLAEWMALWENLGRLFDQAERASLDRKQVMLTAFSRLAAPGSIGRT